MGLPFIDSDAALTESKGKEISALFQELGEEGFRKAEQETLHQIVQSEERKVFYVSRHISCGSQGCHHRSLNY